MGMNVGTAYVTILPSAKAFAGNLTGTLAPALGQAGIKGGKAVEDGINKSSGGIMATFARWGKWATVAAVGAGVVWAGSAVRTGVAYNSMVQSARAAFTTLLGTGEAAEEMLSRISDFAMESPFPRQAFIEATQQMISFGIESDKVIPILGSIQDSVAAFGGGANEIARITDVFSNIQSQGRITGEHLQRLASVGIDAASLLGEQFDMTADEMRDAITSGAIDSEEAIDGLVAGMDEKFGGAAENVRDTWSGALDRIAGATRDIGSAIVEPFISVEGGGLAVEWANNLATNLRVVEGVLPGVISLLSTGKFVTDDWEKSGLTESSPFVQGLFTARTAVATFVSDLKAGFSEVGSAFQTGIGAIGPAAEALWEKLEPIAKNLYDGLKPVALELLPALILAFIKVQTAVGVSVWTVFLLALELVNAILKVLVPVIEWLVDVLTSHEIILNALVTAWTAYKIVMMTTSFIGAINGFIKLITLIPTATGVLLLNTKAWIANRIAAIKAAAATVAAWGRSIAAGVTSAAISVANLAMVTAGWIRSAVVATASGIAHAAAWLRIRIVAMSGAIATVVSTTLMSAAWWRSVAAAVAGAAAQTAAWLRVRIAALASIGPALIGFALMAAGWIKVAIVSMISAIKIAAAWLIALGPIGLIILAIIAVIAIVLLVWKYWDEISEFLVMCWEWIADMAVTIWTAIVDFFVDLWDSIVELFVTVWDAILEFLITAWDAIWESVQSVWNAIKAFFAEFWPYILALFLGPIGILVALIITNWERIKSITSAVWNGIKSFLSSAWEFIKSVFMSGVNTALAIFGWFAALPGRVAGWFMGVVSAVGSAIGSVIGFVQSLPGRVSALFSNAISLLQSAGRDIINGLLNGLKAASGAITGWLMGFLGGMKDSVLGFFGISSPSKLMAYYGEMIGQGLADGIRNSVDEVKRAAEEMSFSADPQLNLASEMGYSLHPARQPMDAPSLVDVLQSEDREVVVQVDSREIARATDQGNRKIRRRT